VLQQEQRPKQNPKAILRGRKTFTPLEAVEEGKGERLRKPSHINTARPHRGARHKARKRTSTWEPNKVRRQIHLRLAKSNDELQPARLQPIIPILKKMLSSTVNQHTIPGT
ncbi:hypothetical protein A2U01_0053954, partial [Trifolium medium]|nr:hypothetical protein [Trifolium medium]